MKTKSIIQLVSAVLVVALLISTVQPASAASITGNVAPSGTDYLMNYLSNAQKLPDRTRYTFEIPQPEENYYSLSYTVSGSDSYTSYDLTTKYVSIGGWTTGNSCTYLVYGYPAGRVYYRLPFSASLISSVDSRTEITVQVMRISNYKDGSASAYYDSLYGDLYSCFYFYNDAFQRVSTVEYSSSGTTVSGSASADSFPTRVYNSSVVIPSEAVYVVPVFYIKRTVPKSSSQPSSWSYDCISPVGMSCSIQFDVMNAESQVDGIWQFNDTLSYTSDVFQTVGFASGGVTYSGMDYYPSDTGSSSLWYSADDGELVYDHGSWYIDPRKVVDFGSSGQSVSAEFYDFLIKNATRIGDSSADAVQGSILVKDYSGSNVLAEHSLKFPDTANVTQTGLTFTSYTDPNVTWDYTYTGSGSFVGVSTVPNAGFTRYKPGTSFVMTSPGSVYLHLEGDIGNGGSGTTDPTDPPAPTDPTDPGGSSGPTEPTKDPLEDEKDQAGVGGNGAFDDVVEIVPDYSADFIEGFKLLASALSYEGTEAVLDVPPIVIPALPGLFPEMEILPAQELDFEMYFYAVPQKWMVLIHALFDVAIVIYAGKELYSLIQETFVLKKSGGDD